jgi:arabinan endo-1,5-alpha-L-arabinosidase
MNAARSRTLRGLFTALWLGVLLQSSHAEAPPAPELLQGQLQIHDPSNILKQGDKYHLFATGRGIMTKSSPDLIHWTNGAPVFTALPEWTTNAVPGYRGHTWAPDVILLNGRYHLYYSISTFGKQLSAIGLTTSPTLDPASPDYRWTDRGPVIRSEPGSPFNAIDPSLMTDAEGRLWMAFGSFWKGIYLVELDPKTGLRVATNSPLHQIAYHQSIEAATLSRHDDNYVLFVNWGTCCKGTNSTYEVRVGRSKTITGPYLDRDGVDLAKGGGTKFLETAGRFIGPGHIALVQGDKPDWFGYHAYDAENNGRSRLCLGQIEWDKDGWPAAKKLTAPAGGSRSESR